MNFGNRGGRQPHREPWPLDRLVRERAITLGHTIDLSTLRTYSSALTSYLTFVRNHNFPVQPTEDTLSFFAVYMSRHISPRSVNSYLSGIAQQLEDFFPTARICRNSKLVHRTMQGCLKLYSEPTRRKSPLSPEDLKLVITHFLTNQPSHDDLLFIAMLVTGFYALLRLGEMAFPDDSRIRDWRKISCRRTVQLSPSSYKFMLPYHKGDRFFSGNDVLVTSASWDPNPLPHFTAYLTSRNTMFPLHSALWVQENGVVPS